MAKKAASESQPKPRALTIRVAIWSFHLRSRPRERLLIVPTLMACALSSIVCLAGGFKNRRRWRGSPRKRCLGKSARWMKMCFRHA